MRNTLTTDKTKIWSGGIVMSNRTTFRIISLIPKDISEIPAIAAQISKDLRTQYVVSYYPANDKRDSAFGAIQAPVNQVGDRKLIARARRGYYARNPRGQASAEPQKKSRGNQACDEHYLEIGFMPATVYFIRAAQPYKFEANKRE